MMHTDQTGYLLTATCPKQKLITIFRQASPSPFAKLKNSADATEVQIYTQNVSKLLLGLNRALSWCKRLMYFFSAEAAFSPFAKEDTCGTPKHVSGLVIAVSYQIAYAPSYFLYRFLLEGKTAREAAA